MIEKINNLFHISGKDISYVIAITNAGTAVQSYFGKKIKITENYDTHLDLEPTSFCNINEETYEKEFMEYSSYGYTDLHTPMYQIENKDGNYISHLIYKNYKITNGTYTINGMPSLMANGKNAETLELILEDNITGLEVVLSYVVFEEYNIIARNAKICNKSKEKMIVKSAYSGGLSIKGRSYDVIYFGGGYAREREFTKTAICEGMNLNISATTGTSSHDINPFVMISEKNATEDFGEVYSMSLIYSGNHSTKVVCDRYNNIRMMQGINPLSFNWNLENEEYFETPQSVICYSDKGIGGISREISNLYKNNLCRSKWANKERPILINNWEATYFEFTEEKLLNIAKKAKAAGIELFVLDDGWFGKRNSDTCSLGDWFVNKEKLPSGIDGLANKINDLGLGFGLWFEPEMINPDSDLYRAHPDWAISVPGRTPATGRNQYILDLSRDDVCDYVIKAVSDILASANISYVKWDMNRYMTDMPYGGYNHKYVLGLYKVISAITEAFPEVLFEGCAGGGGRFDAGIYAFMPQIWTSDTSDAIARLKIQHSTSMGYPASSISAHVTAVPNHQNGRVTSLKTRADVAYFGIFGYELDITKMTDDEFEEIKEQIKKDKELRPLMLNGDFYRIDSPYDGNYCTWEMVSNDKSEAFVMSCKILAIANTVDPRIKLKGLDPNSNYKDEESGKIFGGDELMYRGIPSAYSNCDFSTITMHLKKIM